MRSKSLRTLVVALGVMLIFAACGSDSNDGSQAASEDGQIAEGTTDDGQAAPEEEEVASGDITYTALEFGFDGPDTIAAGETTITLVNDGKQVHELALYALSDGKTFDDVTALFENGPPQKQPKWARTVGRTVAKPGKTSKPMTKDLAAGTYVLLCFVPDKESKMPHAMLGMMKPVTVQ
jgi:plastocyanin